MDQYTKDGTASTNSAVVDSVWGDAGGVCDGAPLRAGTRRHHCAEYRCDNLPSTYVLSRESVECSAGVLVVCEAPGVSDRAERDVRTDHRGRSHIHEFRIARAWIDRSLRSPVVAVEEK